MVTVGRSGCRSRRIGLVSGHSEGQGHLSDSPDQRTIQRKRIAVILPLHRGKRAARRQIQGSLKELLLNVPGGSLRLLGVCRSVIHGSWRIIRGTLGIVLVQISTRRVHAGRLVQGLHVLDLGFPGWYWLTSHSRSWYSPRTCSGP